MSCSSISHRPVRAAVARALAVPACATLGLLLSAAPAAAHPALQPGSAPIGSDGQFTLAIKSELPKVKTTKVEMILPVEEMPDLTARGVKPTGWNVTTSTVAFPRPQTLKGKTYTKGVGSITWTATGKGGIEPLDTGFFLFNATLPDRAATLPVRVVQTYADGQVTRWFDAPLAGAPVPQHPATMLTIGDVDPNAAAGGGHSGHNMGGATPAPATPTPTPVAQVTAQAAGPDTTTETRNAGSALVRDVKDASASTLLILVGIVILLLAAVGAAVRSIARRSAESNATL